MYKDGDFWEFDGYKWQKRHGSWVLVSHWACPCGGRNPYEIPNCSQCGEPNPNLTPPITPDEQKIEPPEKEKEETWRDRPPLFW